MVAKRKTYVADFETTTDVDDCRVWGWGLVEVFEGVSINDVELGTTLASFIDRICEEKAVIYFHNLGFDAGFIIDFLLKDGYKHVEDKARPGEFETLISNMGKHYSVVVNWLDGGRTEFRNSLTKIPMTVKAIAKAYNLSMSKLEIDYDEYRAPDHVLTLDEELYIASDVVIVAQALLIQLNEGHKKLTVGADALYEFKNIFGHTRFERFFPILESNIDYDVRMSYRGGWTYLKHGYEGKVFCDGSVYDVNSLYPSVMLNGEFPYGEPLFFDGIPEHAPKPLFVCMITFTAELRDGFLPCIQVRGRGGFGSREYMSSIPEPVSLCVTSVDLELWQTHYEMDILSYDGGWAFDKCTGIFDEYIYKWNEIKMNSTGGVKTLAKLFLNSLYGKFATNPDVTGKIPTLIDNAVKLTIGPPATRDPVYTALASYVTAYARQITITAAQNNYGRFIYADTDSIHLRGTEPPTGIEVDPVKLGAWKHEYDFSMAKFLRAKRYMELEWNDESQDFIRHTHIAGYTHNPSRPIRVHQFKVGNKFPGKLAPIRVPGGIVLTERDFTLN